MDRNIPRCLIDILHLWYTQCTAVVRWGSAISHPILIRAGVRQGGVLSPTLFSVYINNIIVALRNSGLGLRIAGHFLGCICYADDILILAPSLFALQSMLNLCSAHLDELDMRLNTSKCRVIRFGKRSNSACIPISLDGCVIPFQKSVQFLGITIVSGSKLQFDQGPATLLFYRAFNKLLQHSSCAQSELISVFLLKRFCIPIITYGFEFLRATKSCMRKSDNLMNIATMKIFKISDSVNISYIRQMLGLTDLEEIRSSRSAKFLLNFASKPFTYRDYILHTAVSSEMWLLPFLRNDTAWVLHRNPQCAIRTALQTRLNIRTIPLC
jgi:Reverse transcriptase (RNA-dependent DNA polymerase)